MNGNVLQHDGKVLTVKPAAEHANKDIDFFLDEAIKSDLSKVELFRFDTVSTCNLSCIFCPTAVDSQYRPLNIEKF